MVGAASACLVSSSVSAKAVTRHDFTFPEEGDLKIAVFRPDVRVGAVKAVGMEEANAEWTDTARANLQAAMEEAAKARQSNMVFLEEAEGEDAELLNQYRDMFELVAAQMFDHVIRENNGLPTKTVEERNRKKYGDTDKHTWTKIDWTLGAGASRLKPLTGADYAMFVFTHDSYGDVGRKIASVLMRSLTGRAAPAGVHVGYAGLVELETGNIVWFNTDLEMTGDVREEDGAEQRIRQLMTDFPSRAPQPEDGNSDT